AFFFSSRRRHTRFSRDWSSDVCSSDLALEYARDGFQIPDFSLLTGKPLAADMPVLYARARVYASTIDQVGEVAKGLEQQGIPVEIGRASCRERVEMYGVRATESEGDAA